MNNHTKTLLLIDGSSYLYRAFYAIKSLTSPQGEPTNALYGVLNMLQRIEKEVSFDYCACIFDAKGKNFRHDLYPEYKATRKAMPDELRPQAEWVREMVDLLGWNVLSVPDVEADDVIATLNYQAREHNINVFISTGDKDIAQLVDQNTILIDSMKDERLDIKGVKEKFGVYPDQIVDFLTLTGDTSDNVPGVEKCGSKTAKKWLDEYKTLPNLIEHIDEIKGKIGENLKTSLQWLDLSKKLILLKSDVELSTYLPNGMNDLKRKPIAWQELLPKFQYFGFKKWLKEAESNITYHNLSNDGVSSVNSVSLISSDLSPSPVSHFEEMIKMIIPDVLCYQAITTEDEFNHLLKRLDQIELIGLDTETTSLDAMKAHIVGISLALTYGYAVYIPLNHEPSMVPDQLNEEYVLNKLRPYLESEKLKKIGQNIKYDRHILKNYNIDIKGIVGDSMLASYILESHLGHGLDELSLRHLNLKTIKYEDLCGKGIKQISFAGVSLDDATPYACQDADFSLRLEYYLRSHMDEKQLAMYHEMEIPLSEILFKMERHGILLDKKELNHQSQVIGKKIIELEQQIFDLAGQQFNINSPKQLQAILFEKLHIPTKGLKKTSSGTISTNEEVLEKLALDYPLPKIILAYRTLAKLKSTYTDKLPLLIDQSGRVHTSYAQAVVNTGRLASNNPNLQNIPIRTDEGKKVRTGFIAPPNYLLLSADYSQIELRIMAHLSEDKTLLEAFQNNEDVHKRTAAELFHIKPEEVTVEQRRYAKTINFGLIYGMGQYGLAKSLGITSIEAKEFIDRYFNRYPGVANYMTKTKQEAMENGYVTTIFGRKLFLNNIHSDNGNFRAAAERAAINAPMQGTASDLIKIAMIKLSDYLDKNKLSSVMLLQVHDELIFEVPEDEKEHMIYIVPKIMSEAANLMVPLLAEVGVGKNWEEAH